LDQQLERKFLTHILKDLQVASISQQRGIDEGFFQWKTAGKLYTISNYFTSNYGSLLSATELAGLLKQSTTISEDLQQSITVLFNELQLEPLDTDINFLCDQLFQYHKQALVEHALRRSVETLSERKVDKSIEELKRSLVTIENKFKTEVVRSGTLDADIDKILWEYDDNKIHPERYERLRLGIPSIDKTMKGIPKGSLYLIIAPWKGFKSTLLKCIAVNLAKRGLFVYFHSNEDSRETFHARVAATELKIPFLGIQSKELSLDEETKWMQFLQDCKNHVNPIMQNIYYDEVLTSSSAAYISDKVKELNKTRSVDAILIDHFGRMQPNDKRNMPMWEKMSEISQQLALTALDLRLPMLMTAHSNLQGTRDAKEDSKNIAPEDLGLSSQPLKEVSGAFSFVIENLEDFKKNGNKGFAKFALNLSRYSADAFATLSVDGVISKIEELQLGGTSQVGNNIP
jgi:hypothetical protein